MANSINFHQMTLNALVVMPFFLPLSLLYGHHIQKILLITKLKAKEIFICQFLINLEIGILISISSVVAQVLHQRLYRVSTIAGSFFLQLLFFLIISFIANILSFFLNPVLITMFLSIFLIVDYIIIPLVDEKFFSFVHLLFSIDIPEILGLLQLFFMLIMTLFVFLLIGFLLNERDILDSDEI